MNIDAQQETEDAINRVYTASSLQVRATLADGTEGITSVLRNIIRLIVLAQTLSYILEKKGEPGTEGERRRFNYAIGWGVLAYQNPTNILSTCCIEKMLSLSQSHWDEMSQEYDTSLLIALRGRAKYDNQETQFIPLSSPITSEEDRETVSVILDLLYDAFWCVLRVYVDMFDEYAPEIKERFQSISKKDRPRV